MMEREPEFKDIAWVVWLLAIVALGLTLSGCSTTFAGVCAVKPIGQNEQGITFVMAQCEAQE